MFNFYHAAQDFGHYIRHKDTARESENTAEGRDTTAEVGSFLGPRCDPLQVS